MNMFRDKRFIVPSIVSLTMIFIFIFLGFNNNIIFNLLKGNSVTSNVYYYCKDPSYTLEGNKCTNIIYANKLLVGDANLDGVFNVSDVTYVQLYMSNKTQFNENQLLVSDINKDKVVNETDLALLQRAISGTRVSTSSINDSSKYNIGIDKICPTGYNSVSNRCEKSDVVDAIKFYYIAGDVNSDKKIDNNDLQIISGYIDGQITLDSLQLVVADINKDGVVNISDYNMINSMVNTKERSSVGTNVDYFTIKYDANGGVGSMKDQVITYGTSTPLNENKFTRNGYTFKGWKILNNTRTKNNGKEMWACYKNADKSEKGYADKTTCEKYGYQLYEDNIMVAETANPGEVITMYAEWEKVLVTVNYFTIKYNASGGVGTMKDQTITYGTSTKLSENNFTRKGYTFKGWKILNNTRTSSAGVETWACYKNADKSDKGYTDKTTCEKYGYQIYKDMATVAETANPGEIITMYAEWEKVAANNKSFVIHYDASGGTGTMSDQMITYGKKTKLSHNKFNNNGKLLKGWKIKNNSTNKWACYKNKSQSSKGYADKATCEKYGYQIYKDMTTVAETANPGEEITMYAEWVDLKNVFSVNAEKVFATLELPTTGLYRQKVIQDIYVNDSDVYVSQDNFGKSPYSNIDSTPSELIITKISRSDLSMQEIFREKKCGHGFFTIPSGVLMTTCDVDTAYEKDAHGHKAYKITSKGKRDFLFDAFKLKRESFKIDFNHNIYMARINDGTQRFRLYNYNKNNMTVGSYIRGIDIKDTPYDMQGYALDGKYIYIYYGEGIDSGSNSLRYSVAYIDTYDSTSGKLIKHNKIFESKDLYLEAEGLDYLGDYIYIGIASTNVSDSAYGDYKYANVYRIKKSDLR